MPSIQINIGDHVGWAPRASPSPVPAKHRAATSWARMRAKRIAREMPSADTYFKTLPKGLTLTSLLSDNTIWINYEPTLDVYGWQHGKEIGIGKKSYNKGRWSVLATLIHELAHVNGAPGGKSKAAEQALIHCGLGNRNEFTTGVDDPKTPYNPNIEG